MAKKTISKYFSDISGEEVESNSPTVHFAFDRSSYEIDLTESEAATFREVVAPYIAAARRSTGTRGARAASSASGPSAKDVRAWALDNGFTAPARGRIPASILEAYNAAH